MHNLQYFNGTKLGGKFEYNYIILTAELLQCHLKIRTNNRHAKKLIIRIEMYIQRDNQP